MEFALVLPVLMVVMLAILGYGLVFYTDLSVSNADRAATRLAVVGAEPRQVYDVVQCALRQTGMTNAAALTVNYTASSGTCTVTASGQTGNCAPAMQAGQWVTVGVRYFNTSVVPLPGLSNPYRVADAVTMMMEQPGTVTLPSCP